MKKIFYQYEIIKDGISEIMDFPKAINYSVAIPYFKGKGYKKVFIKFLGYYSV